MTMERVEFLNVDNYKVYNFLRRLCRIVQRRNEKVEAKEILLSDIRTMRSLLKKKKIERKELNRLLDSIEGDIDNAVEKGSRVIHHTIRLDPGAKAFYANIDRLERKINEYTSVHTKREKAMHKIETEIERDTKKKGLHTEKLRSLEKRFLELKNIDKFDESQLSRIKTKIEELKKRQSKKL